MCGGGTRYCLRSGHSPGLLCLVSGRCGELLDAVQDKVPYWNIVEELQCRIRAHVQAVQGQSKSTEKMLRRHRRQAAKERASMESAKEIIFFDFPCFTAIHNVMRDRAVTNPCTVITMLPWDPTG